MNTHRIGYPLQSLLLSSRLMVYHGFKFLSRLALSSIIKSLDLSTFCLYTTKEGRYGKINKCITFPNMLDMVLFMTGTDDIPLLNLLYIVVVHLDTLNASFSGHYVSYVKNMQGNWFKIDDTQTKVPTPYSSLFVWNLVGLDKGPHSILKPICKEPRGIGQRPKHLISFIIIDSLPLCTTSHLIPLPYLADRRCHSHAITAVGHSAAALHSLSLLSAHRHCFLLTAAALHSSTKEDEEEGWRRREGRRRRRRKRGGRRTGGGIITGEEEAVAGPEATAVVLRLRRSARRWRWCNDRR
ncbi:hypothetical protein TEA_018994 [Camellia sinensis var. sinensis]|uniref:USP domain-containing protein n=1 Tax=Camellia sinensis var. sinensis TaxID=542762 RepID=A0A4S4F1A4_CAMSN|nr:hypothetical protein TEA_018994 [Camellia sinensis var. sinensis]